jgi:hypothetical protein
VTSIVLTQSRSRRRWPVLLATAALLGAGGWYAVAQLAPGERGVPPIDSSSNYEVTGVQVDVSGRTADEARNAAWRMAQRKGWKILWARMHQLSPDAAPGLPDSTLDTIVADIEVEAEQVGPHRYIATLGVLFDRGRTGQFLGNGTSAPHSAPLLVIPIQFDGGTPATFETRTAWQKAWARFRTGGSPVDYVRPVGNGVDPLLLNVGQTRRPGRVWWRMLLDQYGAADVIVPEVHLERRYPGGPVAARFVARFGPDAKVIGSFGLVAPDAGGLDRILDEGVKRLDQLYAQALSAGDLRPDPSLTIDEPEPAPTDLLPSVGDDPLSGILDQISGTNLTIQYDTADSAALDQGLAALRSVPGVSAPTVTSLALGGTSLISMSFSGDLNALKVAMRARGWQIDGDGTTVRLRRGGGSGGGAAPAASPPPTAPAATPGGVQ